MVITATFHARVRGSFPGHGVSKQAKLFLPHPLVKLSIVGSLRDRGVACSPSDLQGLNFESCVCRAVSSHHSQEDLLARCSLYVHKSGIKPDSFLFIHCNSRLVVDKDDLRRWPNIKPTLVQWIVFIGKLVIFKTT